MNQPNNIKAEGLLSWWLAVATDGLVPNGKERVTQEIQLHYAEAVEAHLAQGELNQSAEARAIAECKVIKELGDPDIAAKNFREIHLTEEEAESLANLVKGAGKTSMLLLGCLPAIIFLAFAVFIISPKSTLIFDAILSALMVCPVMSFLISRQRTIKAKASLLLVMDCINDLVLFVCAIPFMFYSVAFSADVWIFWMFTYVVYRRIPARFRIWNKTRKMADEFDETTGIAS